MPGKILLAISNCTNQRGEVILWQENFNFEIRQIKSSCTFLDTTILVIPHAVQLKHQGLCNYNSRTSELHFSCHFTFIAIL